MNGPQAIEEERGAQVVGGRTIKLLVLVHVDEEEVPVLFEALRKATVVNANSEPMVKAILEHARRDKEAVPRVVGIEHSWNR